MHHVYVLFLLFSFMFPFSIGVAAVLQWKNSISHRLMLVVLFSTFCLFFLNYFYFEEDYDFYLPFHAVHAGIELIIFPLIYLYMKSIMHRQFEIYKELYHFLPAIVITLVTIYIYYWHIGPADVKLFLHKNRLNLSFSGYQFRLLKVSRNIRFLLVVLQGIVYSIAFNRRPQQYNAHLRNEFSNVESLSINWINQYNLCFVGSVLTGFVLYAILPLKAYKEMLVVFAFFLFSVFVCVIGMVSLRQQKTEVDLEAIHPENAFPVQSNTASDKALIERLLIHMKNNKVYLQPDLSLTQLSRELGTNRTYLSTIINQQMGTNFCSFVNQYRIQEMNEHLKEYPHTSNQELAHIAGFGSVSSMKRAMEK